MRQRIDNWKKSLGTFWCTFWHDELSWPMNGTYYCKRCHRVYSVSWANRLPEPPVPAPEAVPEPERTPVLGGSSVQHA